MFPLREMELEQKHQLYRNDSKIDRIVVTSGGSGYTYGIVDYISGGLPVNTLATIF